MSSITHGSLDGSRVEISLPGAEPPVPFTSTGSVILPTGRHQLLCCGPRDHGLEVAQEADFGVVKFEEDYVYQKGRLRIGWSELVPSGDGAEYRERGPGNITYPTRRWFALWQGERFSFHFQTMGHEQSGSLIRVIDYFELQEAEQCIVLAARDGSHVNYSDGPRVLKWLPELALIDAVQLTSRTARKLPRWAGTAVRGGQLWVAKRGTPHMYFVLAGQGSYAQVYPASGVSEQTSMELLSELAITWSAAG